MDFGSGDIGAEPNTEADVEWTRLSLDGGAVVLYPPFYGGASTFKYNDSLHGEHQSGLNNMLRLVDQRCSYPR